MRGQYVPTCWSKMTHSTARECYGAFLTGIFQQRLVFSAHSRLFFTQSKKLAFRQKNNVYSVTNSRWPIMAGLDEVPARFLKNFSKAENSPPWSGTVTGPLFAPLLKGNNDRNVLLSFQNGSAMTQNQNDWALQ